MDSRRRMLIANATTEKKNLYDPAQSTVNVRLRADYGDTRALNGYFVSGYIPVTAGKQYVKTRENAITTPAYSGYSWYRSNKGFLSGNNDAQQYTTNLTAPENAAFLRFTGLMTDINTTTVYEV